LRMEETESTNGPLLHTIE